MARGFNKVILMGNLTRDPEIRYTASQQPFTRLTVAVSRQWKGRNGELQDEVNFIPVVVWGPQAENCEKYLRKGRPVLVEGRMQVRSYETKTGERRYATDVVAQDINFLPGGRRDDDSSGRGGGARGAFSSNDEPRSFRDEGFGQKDGPGDSFPMDISEMGSSADDDEADIPF